MSIYRSQVTSKGTDNTSDREEQQFSKLYNLTLNYILEISGTSNVQVQRAIDSFVDCFREGGEFKDIDLNKIENICGYLHRYAALHSGLVRNQLSKIIKGCGLLQKVLNSSEVNVLSLGGGPGNDLIGFCSALYENRSLVMCKFLNVTLVDSIRHWSSCFNIIEFLTREDNFGNITELYKVVEITTTFIKMKLGEEEIRSKKFIQSMHQADVILLIKLISVIPQAMKANIANEIMREMREGSLLLIIDSPSCIHLFNGLNEIYISPNQENFHLSVSSSRYGYNNAQNSSYYINLLQKPITASNH